MKARYGLVCITKSDGVAEDGVPQDLLDRKRKLKGIKPPKILYTEDQLVQFRQETNSELVKGLRSNSELIDAEKVTIYFIIICRIKADSR